jgi:hypothetical protein
LGIEGVGTVPPPTTTTSEVTAVISTASSLASTSFPLTTTVPTPESHEKGSGKSSEKGAEKGSEKGPKHDSGKNSGECSLLGPFALLIQGALGVLALMSLVYKRWREHPRRPLKVWSFDVSKQVVGSILLHLANLLMSMLSSGQFDITKTAAATFISENGKQDTPNPCSFYLLNLAIDVRPPCKITDSINADFPGRLLLVFQSLLDF